MKHSVKSTLRAWKQYWQVQSTSARSNARQRKVPIEVVACADGAREQVAAVTLPVPVRVKRGQRT